MQSVPKSERKRVSFIGRTNVGKSSLINAVLNQKLSIVSPISGTTTDPTEKAIEILPAGPLLFTDTPGIDDKSVLAKERIKRTKEILKKSDLAVFVFAPPFNDFERSFELLEREYIEIAEKHSIPHIFVVNKSDLTTELPACLSNNKNVKIVSAKTYENIDELKIWIGTLLSDSEEPKILEGLIKKGDIVILVTPIHPAYPKSRLKPLQVQIIREILDKNAIAIEVKPEELPSILKSLSIIPSLIISDTTVIGQIADKVPDNIMLTSFSIIFAKYKGELTLLKDGIQSLNNLQNGDKVAIIEACTHHRQEGDMGKEVLPRLLSEITNKELHFCHLSGTSFDWDKVKDVNFVLHCGGCMITRKDMSCRLNFFKENKIPVTNYGMLIAHKHGMLDKTLKPFCGEFK